MYVSRGVYLSDIVILLILVLGLFRVRFLVLGPRVFLFPLIGLYALGFLTAFFAYVPSFSFYTAIRWLIAILIYLWLAQPTVEAPRAVRVFIIGLCIHSLIGIAQVARQMPLGLPGELALDPNQPGASVLFIGSARWLRAYGLTFHPNVMGGFLAFALVSGVPLLKQRGWRIAWWLLWPGLLLSFSRSAWIAALIGVGFVLAWLAFHFQAWRRALTWSAMGGLVVVAACLLIWPELFMSRFHPLFQLMPVETVQFDLPPPTYQAVRGQGIASRIELMQIGIRFIRQHPLTGVGAGGFPIAMIVDGVPAQAEYAHLVPITLAAEVGLPALLIWLWLLLAAVWLLVTHWHESDLWVIVLLTGWLSLGIISLFDFYPWSLNAGRLLTVTALGLAGNRLAKSPVSYRTELPS